MSTESTKNPSDTSMTDLSKEIGIAEELCKQALEKFKQVSVDRHSIQHNVIRNYLWLSVTILAAEFTCLSNYFAPVADIAKHPCPYIILALSVMSALFSLCTGIKAMTGTSVIDPSDNYVEMFDYLTANGYLPENHFALLKKEISTIKQSIDEAYEMVHKRGKAMRKMNRALLFSICTGIFAGFLFFISTPT